MSDSETEILPFSDNEEILTINEKKELTNKLISSLVIFWDDLNGLFIQKEIPIIKKKKITIPFKDELKIIKEGRYIILEKNGDKIYINIENKEIIKLIQDEKMLTKKKD